MSRRGDARHRDPAPRSRSTDTEGVRAHVNPPPRNQNLIDISTSYRGKVVAPLMAASASGSTFTTPSDPIPPSPVERRRKPMAPGGLWI